MVIWLAPGLMQKEGFRVAVDPTIQLQRSSNLPKAAVSVQKLENCKFSLIRPYIFIFTNLLAVRAYIIYKPGADTPEIKREEVEVNISNINETRNDAYSLFCIGTCSFRAYSLALGF